MPLLCPCTPMSSCTVGCRINNGGCQHMCNDTHTGVRCSCRSGFILLADGRSCGG